MRTVLNEIKKIRGIPNDAELANQISVPVHTLRSWVQNNSIRKQLIQFCEDHNICLDEVLLGRKRFDRECCENCCQKEACTEYRNAVDRPLSIGEGWMEPRTVVFNTRYSERVQIDFHGEGQIKSSLNFDLTGFDKFFVRLSSMVTDDG